jgi:hypothetical protein
MRRNSGLSLWSVLLAIAIIGTIAGLLFSSVQSEGQYRRADKSSPKSESGLIGDAYAHSQVARANQNLSVGDSYVRLGRAESVSRNKSISLAQNLEDVEPLRKIVYEADLTVVVRDVGSAEKELLALVKELGGYIAEATVNRAQGERLSGQWRLRIPVDKFNEFLDDVSQLGITENRRQTAQDVTEQFVDLEAQIANKKQLEERILGLLEKSTDKISEVIAVEQQLGRIRGEIEQMEGRLKYLKNRTDMTTVSIALREKQDYEPEPAPTLSARIGDTWGTSLTSLGDFGERFLLATVAALPWIGVASVVLIPVSWYASKRSQRKK